LGATIYLSNALTPHLWSARVDPSQVESAIVNLAVNARDAMPDGGRLLIETGNAAIDMAMSEKLDGLPPGDYVRLAVSDTGTGMPASVRERAFEPFFTTKEQGRGTGLGLSMIYGFAKQSGGQATIDSVEGKGTTVTIYLPRHRVEPVRLGEVAADAAMQGGGQVILAVEDDERVRKLTVTRLTQLGYTVLAAASGAEALELLRSKAVDLLFTDVVMPGGMSGYELRQQVRSLYPQMPVLLTSGYAEELAGNQVKPDADITVLRKPYRMADLASAIDDALRAKGSSA
jgi:CheY-like chemotaxis protein